MKTDGKYTCFSAYKAFFSYEKGKCADKTDLNCGETIITLYAFIDKTCVSFGKQCIERLMAFKHQVLSCNGVLIHVVLFITFNGKTG